MAPSQDFILRQLSPAIGAIIEGVDLSQEFSVAVIDQIQEALVTHHAVFFRNQSLTPERQRDIAKLFGELHIHPVYPHVAEVPEIIVLDTDDNNPPDNDNWHTDVTFIETPPMGSLLAAKMIPSCGGDTLWISNIAAYNALSEPMRNFLDNLTATHDFRKSFFLSSVDGDEEKYMAACRKNPPVSHPVVRVHPVTKQKGLFVNFGFTTRINELSKAESDAVLKLLFAHAAKPDFTMRWKWSVGDVAFWDNRLTQHYACADYLPERRVMHRATILGCAPQGPR